MPASTEINISSFSRIQSRKYDSSKSYIALPVKALKEHEYGQEIATLMSRLKKDFNQQNALSLKIEEGYPTAVYGFRIILNSEGIPVVSFGNFEDGANEIPLEYKKDADGDLCLFAGNAQVEFETPKGSKGGNYTDAYVWFKKIRVKAYLQKADKDLTTAHFSKAKNIDQLTELLGSLSGGGGYSYKLKELTDPRVIESKGVTFPLILDVEALADNEPYQGDGFTSRNLKVKRADGKPLYGIDKNGVIGEVSVISVYDNSNAGSVCTNLGAARFLLCKHYGGQTQIIIIKPNGANTPTHTFPHYVEQSLQEAYEAAEDQLINCFQEDKDFYHLLSQQSKEQFIASHQAKSSLPPTKSPKPQEPIDFEVLDNFAPSLEHAKEVEEEEEVFSFS